MVFLLAAVVAVFAQDAARSVWDGVYNDKQAERGRGLYNQYCASCHSDTLSGGEQAPPLAGGDFLTNWNGLTVGDLAERVRTTMPVDKPGKLSRQTNTDIVAYILSVNKFPQGGDELSREVEAQKMIRITSEKPAATP
jgi:cytochrome c